MRAGLLEQGIIQPVVGTWSCFEQQKELLLLKQTHELELQVRLEKMRQEKELALEEMKQKTELVRLEVQNKKLNLIQEAKCQDSLWSLYSLHFH